MRSEIFGVGAMLCAILHFDGRIFARNCHDDVIPYRTNAAVDRAPARSARDYTGRACAVPERLSAPKLAIQR